MDRRRLLASIATVGGAVLGGCQDLPPDDQTDSPPPPSGTPPTGTTGTTEGPKSPSATDEVEFDRVVDMVADRGVDDTGGEPIDRALQAAATDGTLLEFPPGTYLVTQPLLRQQATRLGIRGTGDDPGAVRFVHPRRYNDLFLNVRGGRDSVLENFTVDQTDDRETATGIIFLQADGLRMQDVTVAGFTPTEEGNPDQNGEIDLLPAVTDPDGTGIVERFVSTGGGEVGVYPNSYPGLYSGYHHQGTLRLIDCRVENCGGAGVYTSRTRGTVGVEGGRFANNSVAQVRVAGEGSYIRDAEIVVDTATVDDSRGDYQTVRGVWWESGEFGRTGGVIENCRFVARSSPLRRGLLEVDGTAGAMAVRDSTFVVERDGYRAIDALPPGSSSMGGAPERPWGVTLENVEVTGGAAGGAAVRIAGRPNSTLSDVTIAQSGRNRDGLSVRRSPGTRVDATTVDVPRFPLRLPLRSSGQSCWLEVGADVDLRSRVAASSLQDDPVAVAVDASGACLPSVDGPGRFVVLGRCTEGFVGGVVDEDFDPAPTSDGEGCP